jgi:hypothetical protein
MVTESQEIFEYVQREPNRIFWRHAILPFVNLACTLNMIFYTTKLSCVLPSMAQLELG